MTRSTLPATARPTLRPGPGPALAALLLLNLLACESGTLLSDAPEPAAATVAQVTAEEARIIADEFADQMVISGQAPAWGTAEFDPPTLFTDVEGAPVGWEFPAIADHGGVGSVTVAAVEGRGVVLAWHTEGPAISDSLLALLDEAVDFAVPAREVAFYAGAPGVAGARWRLPDGLDVEEGPLVRVVEIDGERFVHAAPDYVGDEEDWEGRFGPAELEAGDLEEERALRDVFLTGEASALAEAFLGDSASVAGARDERIDVGNGASSFANYYQEHRVWSSGTCHAGCAPVAAAILLHWWDRNDRPGLIPGTDDNDNWDVWDGDVRWTIDQLRERMGTTCDGDQGSTTVGRIDNGLGSYMTSRGYPWNVSNSTWRMWQKVRGQINRGRPVLLTFRVSDDANHTAMVYEYTNNWGSSNDWVCAKTGWNVDPYWGCHNWKSTPKLAITRARP